MGTILQNKFKMKFSIALIAVLMCLAKITADPKPNPHPKPNPKDFLIHLHGQGAAFMVEGKSDSEGSRARTAPISTYGGRKDFQGWWGWPPRPVAPAPSPSPSPSPWWG